MGLVILCFYVSFGCCLILSTGAVDCLARPVLQMTNYVSSGMLNILFTAWLSGNMLVLIIVVALRQARLVLGWVTVREYTILVFNLLSLAIPL